MRLQERSAHHDEEAESEATSSPGEELAAAIETCSVPNVVALLKREVRRREGPPSRDPLEDLEYVDAASYRQASAPLARMLGEVREAAILGRLLETMANASAPSAKSNGQAAPTEAEAALRDYLDERPELTPILRNGLRSPASRRLFASIAPDGLMSLEALCSLSQSIGVPPRITDEEIHHLNLGLPHVHRNKRASLYPLVHALAASRHEEAPEVLRKLLDAGVPLDRKWHGMRPVDRARAAGATKSLDLLEAFSKQKARAQLAAPPKPEKTSTDAAKKVGKKAAKKAAKSAGKSAGKPKDALLRDPDSVELGVILLLSYFATWGADALGRRDLACVLLALGMWTSIARMGKRSLLSQLRPRLAIPLMLSVVGITLGVLFIYGGAAVGVLVAGLFGLLHSTKAKE